MHKEYQNIMNCLKHDVNIDKGKRRWGYILATNNYHSSVVIVFRVYLKQYKHFSCQYCQCQGSEFLF